VDQARSEIVAWVGSQVLPHERDLRAWLRRAGAGEADIDDIVQEAYCRLAALKAIDHIANGRAYFFQTARNIAAERVRRARVIRIDYATEIDALNILDSEPSPERVVDSRQELRKVRSLIEGLPERCREIFKLRRIHGLSQREVADLLKVSENVVEAQAARGLRLILAALAGEADADPTPSGRSAHEHPNRKRDR
jgi:RNA polymerase sigma factor (sigma-70 family)